MGTFAGHALPGTFFFLASLWWTYGIFYRYFRSKLGIGPRYRNTPTFPLFTEKLGARKQRASSPVKASRVCADDFESYFKIICTSMGILGEFVTAMDFDTFRFVHIGNGQHITMYAFFGLTGVVDLLVKRLNLGLPPQTDYCAGFLAYSVEAILFQFHLHGRAELDVSIHTLLLYVVWACALSTLVEMWYLENPLGALARAFFTMVQGTWFWQVGSILYLPFPRQVPWDESNPDSIVMALIIFVGHLFSAFSLQLLIAMLVAWRVGAFTSSTQWRPRESSEGFELLHEPSHMTQTTLLFEEELGDVSCEY